MSKDLTQYPLKDLKNYIINEADNDFTNSFEYTFNSFIDVNGDQYLMHDDNKSQTWKDFLNLEETPEKDEANSLFCKTFSQKIDSFQISIINFLDDYYLQFSGTVQITNLVSSLEVDFKCCKNILLKYENENISQIFQDFKTSVLYSFNEKLKIVVTNVKYGDSDTQQIIHETIFLCFLFELAEIKIKKINRSNICEFIRELSRKQVINSSNVHIEIKNTSFYKTIKGEGLKKHEGKIGEIEKLFSIYLDYSPEDIARAKSRLPHRTNF